MARRISSRLRAHEFPPVAWADFIADDDLVAMLDGHLREDGWGRAPFVRVSRRRTCMTYSFSWRRVRDGMTQTQTLTVQFHVINGGKNG